MGTILFLHVLGALLFLGNILITAFWKLYSDFSRSTESVYFSSKKVLIADLLFTLPGIILLSVTGNLMAVRLGYPMNELNWLTLSNWLFMITGIIWLAVLVPLQFRMVNISREDHRQGSISSRYKVTNLYWSIFGVTATVLPLFVLYLMTAKPF